MRVLTPSDWFGVLMGRTKETPEGALIEPATDLAKAAASEVGSIFGREHGASRALDACLDALEGVLDA